MSALIQPTHLARRAYVYIRPPSRAQVLDHPESTVLQYRRVQRPQDLSGPPDQIGVINDDFSPSAISTHHRPGFPQMAAAVYDPNTNNAPLRPGLPGPLAAEFHLLRSRFLTACEPPAPRGDRGCSLFAGLIRPADGARGLDPLPRLCQQEMFQTLVALLPAHQESAPASVERPSPQPPKKENNL